MDRLVVLALELDGRLGHAERLDDLGRSHLEVCARGKAAMYVQVELHAVYYSKNGRILLYYLS